MDADCDCACQSKMLEFHIKSILNQVASSLAERNSQLSCASNSLTRSSITSKALAQRFQACSVSQSQQDSAAARTESRWCLRRPRPQRTQIYARSPTHTQAPSSRSLIVGSPTPPKQPVNFMRPSNNFSKLALLFAARPSHCVLSRPRRICTVRRPQPRRKATRPSDAV